MRAVVARESGTRAELDDVDEGLLEGAVGIDVAFSSLNYKDGIAPAGRPGIVRQWPLVIGIDTVGTVCDSTYAGFAAGDLVVLNGSGHGEACTVDTPRGSAPVASTGRSRAQEGYLRDLGAAEVIDRGQFSDAGGRPLQQMGWAGVVDGVGSTTLANALAQTRYGGTVAACGLAQGSDLPATVLPFILRSLTLRGIDSVYARPALRQRAWNALATELDLGLLDGLSTVVGMSDVVSNADRTLAGQVRGRTVVDVHR